MNIYIYIYIQTSTIAPPRPPAPSPVTPVGVCLSFVSPVPSSPSPFQPQQSTLPPVSSAHVWKPPAPRATTPAERRSGGEASVFYIFVV